MNIISNAMGNENTLKIILQKPTATAAEMISALTSGLIGFGEIVGVGAGAGVCHHLMVYLIILIVQQTSKITKAKKPTNAMPEHI